VADLEHDHAGRITGLGEARRISPPGSFNTCGWFHPTDPGVVIFASTIERPMTESPGYQRSGRSYRWRFPEEMNIYRLDLDDAAGGLEPLAYDPEAYLAECSLTGDARHLLYCSLASNDGDLYIKDLATGGVACIVSAKGYDGGPFFSPDGRRICYRSDRRGDDLLQIFVGELAFDESGTAVGLKREYQLTDNGHVNFAPYWHPEGRKIAYVSSELGHHNYEIFLMDADPGNLPGSDGTIRYGTARRRITAAAGFDGFPAFNADGSKLMWTSQRAAGDAAEKRPEGPGSQVWVADFVLDTEPE
jgi:TolB protein